VSAAEQNIDEFVREKYQSHINRIKSYLEILSQETLKYIVMKM
jgi:hypothetical protein